jgi:hypothetical protein
MPIYEDPRERLIRQVGERFPTNPTVQTIIRKYRMTRTLSDREWNALKSCLYEHGAVRSLDPKFELDVTVWLRDLGLTIQDVLDLAASRRAHRTLKDQQEPVGRVIVTRQTTQTAGSLQELRRKKGKPTPSS